VDCWGGGGEKVKMAMFVLLVLFCGALEGLVEILLLVGD